jgi:galactose-1-phosphate uridylyltransferase
MMEAARTSETLVNVYQTTRRYNPEDSHLRTHRRENLKSYLISILSASRERRARPVKRDEHWLLHKEQIDSFKVTVPHLTKHHISVERA